MCIPYIVKSFLHTKNITVKYCSMSQFCFRNSTHYFDSIICLITIFVVIFSFFFVFSKNIFPFFLSNFVILFFKRRWLKLSFSYIVFNEEKILKNNTHQTLKPQISSYPGLVNLLGEPHM